MFALPLADTAAEACASGSKALALAAISAVAAGRLQDW